MNIKTRPLSQAEFQRLLAETPNPWKSIFTLAYCSGLRISDLLSLKRLPIGYDITLYEKKTHRKNTIPINPPMREAWMFLYNFHDGEYLLPFRDTSTYRKALVRFCKRSNISPYRIAFHSIRKTTATTIYQSLGFVAASRFLNHAKLTTTMHYIELDAIEVSNLLESSFHFGGVK